ncbi:ROK family protein [Lacticaseibacillus kribbianus]|uniref:ROK family protein n=1 Tax=Lacticaseibacillus kribbianus TaxID=2926292 RepID=UPI001CD2B561|nr:ROK family protein [Lacticaseibacillus kribbianus]
MTQTYIGFDFGGTTIKHGVVDVDGHILTKAAIPTPKDQASILTAVSTIVAQYRKDYPEACAIGISMPGIVRKDGYLITAGAIQCLYQTDFGHLVEQACGLPTTVENDANAAAIAEQWLGAARGVHDYLCVVLGTGVGGGIVINDQIYRGGHGMAGEFGWMITENYDLTTDLERHSLNATSAVVDGLCRQYTRAKRQLDPDFPRVYDARQLYAAAAGGELLAQGMLNQFYADIALGLIDLIAAFDPELILVGGGISANADFRAGLAAAVSDLKRRHKSLARIQPVIDTPVKPTQLKNDAGLLGAVYQTFHRS